MQRRDIRGQPTKHSESPHDGPVSGLRLLVCSTPQLRENSEAHQCLLTVGSVTQGPDSRVLHSPPCELPHVWFDRHFRLKYRETDGIRPGHSFSSPVAIVVPGIPDPQGCSFCRFARALPDSDSGPHRALRCVNAELFLRQQPQRPHR